MTPKSPKQDIEFMRESIAAELETVPISAHLILILGGIFVLIAVLWASFATLDEIAYAEGKVIPSTQVQVVQNLEGGILTNVKVRPGQVVRAGQTMLTLDDTHFASSYKEGKLTSNALIAMIARLEAEISGQTSAKRTPRIKCQRSTWEMKSSYSRYGSSSSNLQ